MFFWFFLFFALFIDLLTDKVQPLSTGTTKEECSGHGLCFRHVAESTQPTPPNAFSNALTPGQVREVFVIHVGGTRCVTSSTDHSLKIQARITLTVEVIRTCICLFLLYV